MMKLPKVDCMNTCVVDKKEYITKPGLKIVAVSTARLSLDIARLVRRSAVHIATFAKTKGEIFKPKIVEHNLNLSYQFSNFILSWLAVCFLLFCVL